MSPRWRGVIALVIAALAFAAIVWFDTTILLAAQHGAAASFDIRSYLPIAAVGIVGEASVVILMAALAWWSRSLLVGVVFVIAAVGISRNARLA